MPNFWELKEENFPENEPVLKQKRGNWYRPNNSGYTNDISQAGLFSREEALRDCFSNGWNGHQDVLAVPVRMLLEQEDCTLDDLNARIAQLERLKTYIKIAKS